MSHDAANAKCGKAGKEQARCRLGRDREFPKEIGGRGTAKVENAAGRVVDSEEIACQCGSKEYVVVAGTDGRRIENEFSLIVHGARRTQGAVVVVESHAGPELGSRHQELPRQQIDEDLLSAAARVGDSRDVKAGEKSSGQAGVIVPEANASSNCLGGNVVVGYTETKLGNPIADARGRDVVGVQHRDGVCALQRRAAVQKSEPGEIGCVGISDLCLASASNRQHQADNQQLSHEFPHFRPRRLAGSPMPLKPKN